MPFEIDIIVPEERSFFGDLEPYYCYVLDYKDLDVVMTKKSFGGQDRLFLALKVRQWLRRHKIEHRAVTYSRTSMELYFRHKSDAMLFKLSWA